MQLQEHDAKRITIRSKLAKRIRGHYLRGNCEKMKTAWLSFKTRPWFIKQAEASTFSHYTSPYMDFFTHHPTITIFKPIITPEGKLEAAWLFI